MRWLLASQRTTTINHTEAMNTHRNNPDSDEMQQADHENRRAAFTAKMEALHEANEPTTPSAEPTPETDAHKCGYICNHCKQHFPGYAQYWEHKCKTATLPESSDAPTPETDDQAKHWSYRFCDAPDANIYINAEFARRLERERDEARRRITELETELESHAWEISPAMAQAKIDQLNAQLDEARAELAKIKTKPTPPVWRTDQPRTLNELRQAMEDAEDSPTGTIDPPTEGSAVEWAEKRLFIQWDDDGNPQWYLYKTDALKLARRADEARAELAKRSGDSYIDAPPTDGSAVEWVTMEFRGKDKWDLCANGVLLVKNLTFDVAEAARITLNAQRSELARRCEEAEAKHEAFRDAIRTKEANELAALSEADTLRAQLAAEVERLRAKEDEEEEEGCASEWRLSKGAEENPSDGTIVGECSGGQFVVFAPSKIPIYCPGCGRKAKIQTND